MAFCQDMGGVPVKNVFVRKWRQSDLKRIYVDGGAALSGNRETFISDLLAF